MASQDGYRQFSDEPNYDGYSRGPPPPASYGLPPPPAGSGAQPGQIGFNVSLQPGFTGYSQPVNVPVKVHVSQLGPGGRFVGQQLQQGQPGHLPKGAWSDHLCACQSSILITVLTCFCPCIRFGMTVSRAFPETGCIRPCAIWLVLYVLFVFLWYIGGAFIGGTWLWIPAMIITLPIIGYSAWYRMKIREKYDIMGTLIWDYVVDLFCLICAMCQEARHVDRDLGIPL